MTELLTDWNVAPTIWLIFGLALLIGEVLGAAGFLVGAAIAAIGMALVTWLFPDLSVVVQVVYFAVAAGVATYVYVRFFRATDQSNADALPSRTSSMIGREFVLEADLRGGGEQRAQIGDTMWVVFSKSDIERGTAVVVVDAENMKLEVEVVS